MLCNVRYLAYRLWSMNEKRQPLEWLARLMIRAHCGYVVLAYVPSPVPCKE